MHFEISICHVRLTIFLIINSVGYVNLYSNVYNTLESHCIYLSIERSSIIKSLIFHIGMLTIIGNIDERHKNMIQ